MSNPYDVGVAATFKKAFEDFDGSVEYQTCSGKTGESDFTSQMTITNPDILLPDEPSMGSAPKK